MSYVIHYFILGSETSALQNCPADLFGSYNYDTCIDVNSNSTSLNVCDTRQQLIFNYTLCNTPQMFTCKKKCLKHIYLSYYYWIFEPIIPRLIYVINLLLFEFSTVHELNNFNTCSHHRHVCFCRCLCSIVHVYQASMDKQYFKYCSQTCICI
jgi:hypothetical protein